MCYGQCNHCSAILEFNLEVVCGVVAQVIYNRKVELIRPLLYSGKAPRFVHRCDETSKGYIDIIDAVKMDERYFDRTDADLLFIKEECGV